MPRVALEAPEDGQVDENLFVRHRMHYVTVPVMRFNTCDGCAFGSSTDCRDVFEDSNCTPDTRSDRRDVIWVKRG